MFFVLSKVLGFFASLSNVLIVAGLVGLALLPTRFRRAGLTLAIVSLLSLASIGYSPIGNVLIQRLEDRFPAWDARGGDPHGIVVLGGAISPALSQQRDTAALNESAERVTVMAALARRYPAARIVFSGGSGALIGSEIAEAEVAARLMEALGIARERIEIEGRSRNTVENALYTRDIVKPKPNERWLLVTSGYHMPRAVGAFRQAGFHVEAHPVDFRTGGAGDALGSPFPTLGDGLRRTDTAMREWVGLLVYWLTGRSSELFPGPRARGGCDLAAADACRP